MPNKDSNARFTPVVKHATSDSEMDVPWTLFLSSDRRMTRNLTREIIARRNSVTRIVPPTQPPTQDGRWSDYFRGFVDLCPTILPTFIGSNRQMVRRATYRATSSRKK